jgi:hypothetical protein
MSIQFNSGWSECQNLIRSTIEGSEPCFIGRMGGSDTDAVAARLAADIISPEEGRKVALQHLSKLRKFNGYYDLDNSNEKYLSYLDLLLSTYLACDAITLVDAKLLTMYFSSVLNPVYHVEQVSFRRGFEQIIGAITSKDTIVQVYPYTFYQQLRGPKNLFRVFEETLSGKRVLIVSPFEASIHANWGRRSAFFRDFRYPEFEVLTVNAPITYEGLPAEFYPHGDWFETLDALNRAVGKTDFDVALLSCGSYAQPIGRFIQDIMGKKAIYVGGILQLFFGIIGRRYENPFFLDAINRDAFISPVERERFLAHVVVKDDAPKEHFGAYF